LNGEFALDGEFSSPDEADVCGLERLCGKHASRQ
jgi:hypothetical protein